MKIEPSCFDDHMKPWMIEPTWFSQAVANIKSGLWKPRLMDEDELEAPEDDGKLYQVVDRVAVIAIDGHMQRGRSKFGGASTVRVRRALSLAEADNKVGAVLLRINSPGGTADGTRDLAEHVRKLDARKPVFGHIEGTGASAAYCVAARTRRLFASPDAEVGSIGAVAVLEDTSKQREMEGVTVHVLTSDGAEVFKGAGAPGAELTDEQLGYFRDRLNNLMTFFLEAVQQGRGLSEDATKALADGRVHIAAQAAKLKLIDGVQSLEQTLALASQQARRNTLRRRQQLAAT